MIKSCHQATRIAWNARQRERSCLQFASHLANLYCFHQQGLYFCTFKTKSNIRPSNLHYAEYTYCFMWNVSLIQQCEEQRNAVLFCNNLVCKKNIFVFRGNQSSSDSCRVAYKSLIVMKRGTMKIVNEQQRTLCPVFSNLQSRSLRFSQTTFFKVFTLSTCESHNERRTFVQYLRSFCDTSLSKGDLLVSVRNIFYCKRKIKLMSFLSFVVKV